VQTHMYDNLDTSLRSKRCICIPACYPLPRQGWCLTAPASSLFFATKLSCECSEGTELAPTCLAMTRKILVCPTEWFWFALSG
jgi:hypothetical protein